jgi:hypothetical protein
MKTLLIIAFLCFAPYAQAQIVDLYKMTNSDTNGNALRHVVLFKFKSGTPQSAIEEVEKAFASLPLKIPEIKAFEWGTNNSPEGLDKGFTHCFILTFDSEADRDAYLPHPDHKRFGEVLSPWLEDVLVLDYWVRPDTP